MRFNLGVDKMQLDFLMFLQKLSNPILDKFFMFITDFGSETFYVLIITYIYWCINKKLGTKLFVVTMISGHTSLLLKEFFKTSRPIAFEGIKSIYTKSAPGYSFPSGHTQGTATFWYYLIKKINNKKFSILGWSIILLVGFSRLYLRVHWPVDVIGGLIIGIGIVFLIDYLIEKIIKLKLNYTTSIILAIILPNILIFTFPTDDTIKLTGIMTSALIGFITEHKYINFEVKSSRLYQIIKYVIGITIVLLLKSYLKSILPEGNISNYIRYFIIGLWITLFYPIIIKSVFNRKRPL